MLSQKKRSGRRRSSKRSRQSQSAPVNDGLEGKVARTGGRLGYGLEDSSDHEGRDETTEGAGVYGGRSVASRVSRRVRQFDVENKPKAKSQATQQDNGSVKSNVPTNPYATTASRKSRRSGMSTVSSMKSSIKAKKALGSRSVHIVCAISENLAKETCVASLDAGSPIALHVTKQGNGQIYSETMAYLEVLQPDEVLLNEGRRNSQLAKKVLSLYKQPHGTENPIDTDRNRRRDARKKSATSRARHFSASTASTRNDDATDADDNDEAGESRFGPCSTSTVVKFVPRAYFDQTKGAELLRRIARSDTYDPSLVEEYILLSSAHAVLQYTQLCLGANFARNSVHLNINAGGNNRMNIDRSSLLHLELLANAKTGKMPNSLIGTVDCTKTTVGSRLLRTNLMAPPMRVDTINTRLDLVTTFLNDEDFFYTVLEHLSALPDIDKMLATVALVPWKRGKKKNETPVTARMASKGISAIVCIKSIIGAMPAFASALEEQLTKLDARQRSNERGRAEANDNATTVTDHSLLIGLGSKSAARIPLTALRNQLLRAILMTMKQPALEHVMDAILDIFVESTTFDRNPHAMRHQECFALKPNSEGMMDVIRKAFLNNVDDIYRLADEYAKEYDIRVAVKETASRGYYLSIPGGVASELPQVFIQPVVSGRAIHCTTQEVLSLNGRAQENVQDLLLMTHERIQEVLDVARSQYDALASLSDAIALLDMCHCFADNVVSSRSTWCRPIVTDGSGDIDIRNGRYGIDTSSAGLSLETGDYIPNDIHASHSKHFTIISGVNGAGKSMYLKQLAILVVLGHCGSYVPL